MTYSQEKQEEETKYFNCNDGAYKRETTNEDGKYWQHYKFFTYQKRDIINNKNKAGSNFDLFLLKTNQMYQKMMMFLLVYGLNDVNNSNFIDTNNSPTIFPNHTLLMLENIFEKLDVRLKTNLVCDKNSGNTALAHNNNEGYVNM